MAITCVKRRSARCQRQAPRGGGAPPPSGDVTFLVTDIEDSTPLYYKYPEDMPLANRRHMDLLDAAVDAHHGFHFKTVGDAYQVAFPTAADALRAAVEARRALVSEEWGATGPIRVRLVLHTGSTFPFYDERQQRWDYPPTEPLIPAHRLLSACRGDQLLLTETTKLLVDRTPPPGVSFLARGAFRLKGMPNPERVYQVEIEGMRTDDRPLKGLRAGNLSAALTPLIGRDPQVAEVVERLKSGAQLITLLGPGGIGKTRLALAVAEAAAERFEDGAWFVDLSPLSDAALVLPTLAAILGIREAAGIDLRTMLRAELAGSERLLVLDNCEQVLDAGPDIVDLLASCRKMQILTTSRVRLNLEPERIHYVPELAAPAFGSLPVASELELYGSVELFIERARAVKPDFAVTDANAAAVAAICQKLEGIPLAIELAAALIRVLSPQDLLKRLDERFRVLTGGARNLPSRQRTLEATFTWSHNLLSNDGQRLFARLAAFSGGATLETIESVCNADGALGGWPLDTLSELVDHSLLNMSPGMQGDTRYTMLEMTRQFAEQRLAASTEGPATIARHRQYFLDLAESAAQGMQGTHQSEWFARLEEEQYNMRAVLHRARNGADWDTSLRLGSSLSGYWNIRGHWEEACLWLQEALTGDVSANTTVRGKALIVLCDIIAMQGDYDRAERGYSEGLTLLRSSDDRSLPARCLVGLGDVAYSRADYGEGEAYYQEALALSREANYQAGIADCLTGIANIAFAHADYSAARRDFQTAADIYRKLGDPARYAYTANGLADVAFALGDLGTARQIYDELLVISRSVNDQIGIPYALCGLGCVAMLLGDDSVAEQHLRDGLAIYERLGHRSGRAYTFNELGDVAAARGDFVIAARYHRDALAIHVEIGDDSGQAYSLCGLGEVLRKQQAFHDATQQYQAALGLYQPLGERRGIARCYAGFGDIARDQGLPDEAQRQYEQALALNRELGAQVEIAQILESLGDLAVKRGESPLAKQYFDEALALYQLQGRSREVERVRLRGSESV